MPSPKECALKFKPGTKEYNDCGAYKGKFANKGKPARKPVSKPAGRGGY